MNELNELNECVSERERERERAQPSTTRVSQSGIVLNVVEIAAVECSVLFKLLFVKIHP